MASHSDVKIVVASHKPYWMPDDSLYLPIQVGSSGKDPITGFMRDDVGAENISSKNSRYCELTALYWAWKNLDADYIGLAHYRRHFAGCGERGVLTSGEAMELVKSSPVVMPRKRHYYIETVGNHYAHTFDAAHLEAVRASLRELSPEVLEAFEAHLNTRASHIWNMTIMRKDILDQWCSWLFPVLGSVEERISFEGMTPFEERVMGRLSERLIDPWLLANGVSFSETEVAEMEQTNWIRKGGSFLAAKFGGKKYRESF